MTSNPENTHDDAPPPDIIPLLHPAEGVPPLCSSARDIADAAEKLAAGHGAFAVDAERASGFRYSNRAYLIQIRRAGAGTVLIDPVSHGEDPRAVVAPLAAVMATDEWILHAADQDLPCLAELGMTPAALYDTELASRLAGFDRVNLASMVQRLLGLGLAKGHGAADWSQRPLPPQWLNYAALDVEILIELREAIADILAAQQKTQWAYEEFEHLRHVQPALTRRDQWRRTSGIHKVRTTEGLAAVRELWMMRDKIARRRDTAPGRVLPDSAIIAAATAQPQNMQELAALPIFSGPKQRRNATVWLTALETARTNPQPPEPTELQNDPPPAVRWSKRKPEAAARLEASRNALTQLSKQVNVPTENLVSPELVRKLCWDWPASTGTTSGSTSTTNIDTILRTGGARRWQRELVVPVLSQALNTLGNNTTEQNHP